MGSGRSFQRTNIFQKLTVFENLQAAFIVHHRRGRNFWARSDALYRDETAALLASIGLAGAENMIAGTLSYGNQKQLELGLALASAPQVLLLDEPTAGMSARETHETIALLERIAAERSLTLLFTEHDMEVVFQSRGRSRCCTRSTPNRLLGKPDDFARLMAPTADVRFLHGEGRHPHRLSVASGLT
jgi:branched-chain amino acid transport system ATP-binding protein